MKISEMSKAELVEYMRNTGEIHRYDQKSKAWQKAFSLFNGQYGDRLVMDCAKCVAKVQEWLKK